MALQNIAEQLEYAVPKIRLLLVNETTKSHKRVTIQSPVDAARLLSPLRNAPEENFISLHLNAKNEVIGIHEVSHGTLSMSLVHPREVFKATFLQQPCNYRLSQSSIRCCTHSEQRRSGYNTTTLKSRQSGRHISNRSPIVGPSEDIEDVFSVREHHPSLWTDEKS